MRQTQGLTDRNVAAMLFATTATGLLRILQLVPHDAAAVLAVGHSPVSRS